MEKTQILISIKIIPLICQNEPLDVSFSELLVSRGNLSPRAEEEVEEILSTSASHFARDGLLTKTRLVSRYARGGR